jgi:uncharacterized protein YndB with AHSA1/START domain
MVKKILVAIAILIALFAGYVALQPAGYRIVRSEVIAAPPQVVYGQIADFHAWSRWAPWNRLDPKMAVDYGGPTAQAGSTYHWKGDDKSVGEGKMTLAEVRPPERILIDLEFIKPWASKARNEFVLQPDGGGTKVSWVMSGENDFIGKAYGVFANMDKAVGGMFEEGLRDLRKVAEAESVRIREEAARAGAPPPAPAPPPARP